MNNFVDEVLEVSDWALVKVRPGMMPYAKSALTLTSTDPGNKAGTKLYQYRTREMGDKDQLYVPRALVGHLSNMLIGKWVGLGGVESKWSPESRPGQKETIDKFIKALDTHKYGGILQAVTGAGKTVMALEIACRLGLTTLIVVPRTSLMQQWRDQIKKWTSATDEEIGTIQGPLRQWKGKKFVVAMIHTLAQAEEIDPNILSYFGTVIFDECHVVGAETFSKVAPLFWSRWRIGLSATPRRSDGMDPVFYWHLGPIISRFTQLQAKARVRILPYRGRETSHAGCVWNGKLNLGRYFNRIASSQPRFEFIKGLILKLAAKEHEVLVLCDRINYIKAMKAALIREGIPESKIGLLIGKEKQLDRKIIIGTYGSAGMGVDIPRLSALVLAVPRADIEQAVGRVLRQGSPIVVDVVDVSSSIMIGWSRARKKFYRAITDDIQDRSVIYS